MELSITRGMETTSLMILNFIPIKDASKIVIGTLQIPEAPMYVKITESFAPFFKQGISNRKCHI